MTSVYLRNLRHDTREQVVSKSSEDNAVYRLTGETGSLR